MRFALTLFILLLLALPAQALDPTFSVQQVSLSGNLSSNRAAVLVPAMSWRIETAGTLHLVDDQAQDRIPNPMSPGNDLFSQGKRVAQDYPVDAGSLQLSPFGSSGMFVVTDASQTSIQVHGTAVINATGDLVLDRSHYKSDGSVFASSVQYDVGQQAALEAKVKGSLVLDGSAEAYAWGLTLAFTSNGSPVTVNTGSYDDDPSGTGAARTTHTVFGQLHLQHLQGAVESDGLRVFASELVAEGDCALRHVTGSIPLLGDVLQASDADLKAKTGLQLSFDGTSMLGGVQDPPASYEVVGGTLSQPHGAFSWTWLLAILLLAAVAYASPTLSGFGGRNSGRRWRTEGYALWASWADGHGWKRLASWWEGLAVRTAPRDPQLRLDHGILLQSNRKWKKALKEHEAVERLLNGTPDPGIRGFNAFKAATAATELGQDDVAVEWLQQALELEPSLREQIRGEPTLRRLRSHPDAANFS